MTTNEHYSIRVKMAHGYELPDWHVAEHDELTSAQAEVTKLRQWDADMVAIKDIVING